MDGLSQKIVESVCKRMEELVQAYANGGGRECVSLHSTPTNHYASHSSKHTTKYLPKHPRYNKPTYGNRPPYHKIPKFDEEAYKQRQLKGILDKLTPQNFERLFQQVKRVNIDNVTTLSGLVSQIFDKALMEPNFCEMYADFCFHLAADLPDLSVDNEKITFKRLLLNKCQEEFERGEREEEEANKAEEEGEVKQTAEEIEEQRLKERRRMLGNIRLIGELYKKRFLTERLMHECINKLLGNDRNPDEENIEALCELMSTIGEMIDHPTAKDHIDAYFEIMTQLSNNMELSSRVRVMLKDAIDLRKNKWQQRRKVQGSKKIEDVHRDAAQESQAQSSRLSLAPRAPMEYAPRTPNMLSSPSPQSGGYRCFDKPTSTQNVSWPEERLQYKSLAAIREFYSARDEKEVALCIKDLNNPSFYPSMISIWITDSFEMKDMEREILTKLLINLTTTRYGTISRDQLIKGFESVLAVLEDAVIDAPKAAEFLGLIFAQVILENVVSLSEIGRLIYEGGEEQGSLVEVGLAAEVLGCILEIIKSEKGDSVFNEILSNSNLQLEKFRPQGTKRSLRIDKFI